MYRHLSKEERAPFPQLLRAIHHFQKSLKNPISEEQLNSALIEILHRHNWRKCEYVRALRQRAHAQALLRSQLRKRSVYCFKR